jgi:glycosyltransferase involved in cell wall biosynthesis
MLAISIVIPALEEEKWIADTVSQFKTLSFPHEVIVSDGGSQDNTAEIARAHTYQVCVMTEGKPSAARQRNDGAKLATGQYLAFVDCSVQIPNCDAFFRQAIAYCEDDIELVAIVGPQRIVPEIETLADRIFLGCQNFVIWFQNNMLGRGAGTGKFMFMRRAAFEQIGGFREKLIAGEDLDLVLRLAKIGKTRFMSDLAIIYPGRREHQLGWARLIWIWTINVWWIWLFDCANAKEWKPIR